MSSEFYGELAPWWPLISAPEDYQEEAAFAAKLLQQHAAFPVRGVLELGSGGGNNASHLKASFDMTLVDLSTDMLAVSRQLNPECEHLEGDMRSIRLGRTFDAVFVHDAIAYMTSETDLAAAFTTAFVHCRPGGVALIVPDCTSETFEPSTDHGGHDGQDGRQARYLSWTNAPKPGDTWFVVDYAFLLRDRDGTTHAASDSHRNGLFPRDTWIRLLTSAGFDASAVREETTEDRFPRDFFVGCRPST